MGDVWTPLVHHVEFERAGRSSFACIEDQSAARGLSQKNADVQE